MELTYLAILMGGFLAAAVYLVPFARKSFRHSWLLAAIGAVILTPVTLLLLNQNRLVLPEQNEAIEWVTERWQSRRNEKKKYDWVKSNFIFVDVSFSQKLIQKPGSNQLGKSTITITDREALARFFTLLQKADSLTDFVICDLYYDTPSPDDSLLMNALAHPAVRNRLITGDNFLSPTIGKFASMNDSLIGNIVESTDRNLFSTHRIYRHGRASLAYLAYSRMKGLAGSGRDNSLIIREKKKGQWASLAVNAYIPQFELTDENELYPIHRTTEETEELASEGNYFELGDLSWSGSNELWFAEMLQQRKAAGQRNIIFLGAFGSDQLDIHQTHWGKLHGATIQLNLLYSLYKGQHRINAWYLLYLLICMTLLLYVAIRHSLDLPLLPSKKTKVKKQSTKKETSNIKKMNWHTVGKAIQDIFFVSKLDSWLFIAFILITAICWGRIVNGFALVILVKLCTTTFKYYKKFINY